MFQEAGKTGRPNSLASKYVDLDGKINDRVRDAKKGKQIESFTRENRFRSPVEIKRRGSIQE